MAGSKNSMYLFIIAAILFIGQAAVSMAAYDDWLGAMVSGTFTFLMIVAAGFARSGAMSPVMQKEYEVDYGHTTVQHWRDTGQRIQCTPCFGFCGGIGAIIVGFMFAEGVGVEAIIIALIGAVFAFLASFVFIYEYRGEYFGTAGY